MNRFLLLSALLALSVSICGAASIFDFNLIVNSDAEAGPGSPDGAAVVPAPGWTTTGNFTPVQWGIGGFPAFTEPGPADRGLNFFAGGPNTAFSSASQTVDLSSAASGIDSGLINFLLDGYIGGFAGQNDNAVLTVNFLNGALGVIG